MKKWMLQAKKADFNRIAKEFGISEILARLIRNRDVVTDEEIEYYLNANISDMHDPFVMKDMEAACEIIKSAIEEGKSIRVIGDYDIDGVCATTILVKGLSSVGGNVSHRLPDRIKDGYGLNMNMIDEAKADGIELIITCDNGIAASKEIKYAKDLGIDVVVTDHHEIPFEECDGVKTSVLPPADAVVDPHRDDDDYPFKNICGGMVAYKLILALQKRYLNIIESLTDELLDFAAFSTIGDIMPLADENRIAVKYGLDSMKNTANIGLSALIDATGVKRENLSVYHVGFILGPCINSVGRLESAETALELFLTENVDEANALSRKLKDTNDIRKSIMDEKIKEAIELVENNLDGHDYSKDTVLVVFINDCHESIAGLIAGRLREHFVKPSIVFTDAEEGIKGSGRSIECYNIFEELTKCKDLFTKFGGHPMAAGLSMPKDNLTELRKRINDNSTLTEADLVDKLSIDIDMPINYVSMKLINEIDRLAPYGTGNPAPLFAQKNLKIVSRKSNPKGNMVTLLLQSGPHGDMPEKSLFATMFGDAKKILSDMEGKSTITVAYVPEYNDFFDRVQIRIKEYIV